MSPPRPGRCKPHGKPLSLGVKPYSGTAAPVSDVSCPHWPFGSFLQTDSEELQGLTVRDHMGSRMWEELSVPGTEKGCPPCSPLLTCTANTDHPNHVSHQEGETDPVFGSQASFSGLRSGGLSPPSGNPVQGHTAPWGKKKKPRDSP